MKRFGSWSLLVVLAGASCSGSSSGPGDGGPGGGGGLGGSAAVGGGGTGGGGGGSVGGSAAGGTSGTGGGLAGHGGWGVGGIDPSCVRPDAQLHRFLNLDVSSQGFPGEHSGEWVYVVTRNATSGVLGAGRGLLSGPGFTLHFEGGYERNTSQMIEWFADADGSGDCIFSSGDHVGYMMIGPFDPAGNDAVSATIVHNDVGGIPGEGNSCNGGGVFGYMADMSLSAAGFAAYNGATVYLLTRATQNGAVFARGETTIAGGGFGFYFPRGYAQQTTQEVFWFVDADGDGVCTSSDRPGYAVTPASAMDTLYFDITDNHVATSVTGADVCVVLNGCPIAP
jgi:hypothetical protein